MYWESGRSAAAAAGQASPQISLSVASTVFPGEIFPARTAGWKGLPQPHLLPRGRQGRPLRRLGAATAIFRRSSRGLPAAPL